MWFTRGYLGESNDPGDEVWRILISKDKGRTFIATTCLAL